MEKFFLSEYGLHLKNIQNGKWCYIFERIFKIFPWRSSFAVPILVDLAKLNCAFWQYSKFLCLLCGYEIQKNYFSKNLKFCTHSQCSLAHMLQRHILSSNHEPQFLFRNFEISALLTREKRPTKGQNEIFGLFYSAWEIWWSPLWKTCIHYRSTNKKLYFYWKLFDVHPPGTK